jgi:hypothetical protein
MVQALVFGSGARPASACRPALAPALRPVQVGDWVPPGTTPPGAASPADGSSEDLLSLDKGDGTATTLAHAAHAVHHHGLAHHRANGAAAGVAGAHGAAK